MTGKSSDSKKKRDISPEARQKLSELAKKRHAEGRFGGKEFGKLGGRPRKDRAAKRVAEAAQSDENAQKITKVFKDAIDDGQPMGIRLKGAEGWLAIEREETKVSLQEEEIDAKQHSREELIDILSKKLTHGPTAAILRARLAEEHIEDADIVEVDAVEVVDEADS